VVSHRILSTGKFFVHQPRWSPDGSRIAYDMAPTGPGELRIVKADGSGDRLILRDSPSLGLGIGFSATDWDWTRDGKHLVFVSASPHKILIIDVDKQVGSDVERIISDAETFSSAGWYPLEVAASPTTDRLAVVYYDQRQQEQGIALVDWNGTNFTPLRTIPDVPKTNESFANIEWAPDGRRLAYTHGIVDTAIAKGTNRLEWITITSPGQPKVVTDYLKGDRENGAKYIEQIRWSPDGDWIALKTIDGTIAKWEAIHPDGSGRTSFGALYGDIDWQPCVTAQCLTVLPGAQTETTSTSSTKLDKDDDGVANDRDNCPSVWTKDGDQADRAPRDGVGDACDPDLVSTGKCPSGPPKMHVTFNVNHEVAFPAGANGCWTWDHPTKHEPKKPGDPVTSGGGIRPPGAEKNQDWREHWIFCHPREGTSKPDRPMRPGFWVFDDFTSADKSPPVEKIEECARRAAGAPGSTGPENTVGYVTFAFRCRASKDRTNEAFNDPTSEACEQERRSLEWFRDAKIQKLRDIDGVTNLFMQLYDAQADCPSFQEQCEERPPCRKEECSKNPIVTPSLYDGWNKWIDASGRHVAGAGTINITYANGSLLREWVRKLCLTSLRDRALVIYSYGNVTPAQMKVIVATINACTR
jgi:Tol biopolymer transport system component